MSERPTTQAVVGPVRFSYMSVFKARKPNSDDDAEFSVTLLIPKQPTQQCAEPVAVGKAIRRTLEAALTAKFGSIPPKWDSPLKDGDKETSTDGVPKHPGYWYIKAKCGEDYPPALVDASKNKVAAGSGWKSGDWGKVFVNAYAYDFKGKRGAALGLRAVQFLYVDEGFGSAATSADAFAMESGDAPDAQESEEYDVFASE